MSTETGMCVLVFVWGWLGWGGGIGNVTDGTSTLTNGVFTLHFSLSPSPVPATPGTQGYKKEKCCLYSKMNE